MDEFKESANLGFEKQSNEEQIINFLGLNKAPKLAELQEQFNFTGELRPWWLEEKKDDVSDRLRLRYRPNIKGPVDPIAVLQSELKKNPKNNSEEIELIYPRTIQTKTKGGISLHFGVQPSKEMISEAVKYLQKIGFHPIRGENWVLKGESWPTDESKKSYHPTIYEDIEVKVVRDKEGKAEKVNLFVFNK